AAGDAGGALGVALLTWFQLLGNERTANPLDAQSGTLLGPRFSDDETRAFLDGAGAKYRHFDDEDELIGYAADRMVEEKVVGWMQGRMEFGPRALGSRSIIGDARSTEMQSVMNLKIKFRESFRPFAPSVMQERVQDFFEMEDQQPSPYMLLVAPVREERRAEVDDPDAFGMAKLRQIRSDVPGITHVDFSARVQTVDRERHGRYHQLIQAFEERTGYGVVINTSFNVRGEPIVCSPADAYNCFMGTGMDVLVIDNFVLLKEEQEGGTTFDREAYLAQFELD
ncbi:MAG: carbamoyltransferase C-terminal domain-containing protein, partial [Myxococcota bacterium]|nr:carbamoyltransferase C-terminal domain-containing protein [Myxococcota bacterium]